MNSSTEVSLTPTRPILRGIRLSSRRLTRAHLALQRPTAVAETARACVPAIAAALSEQLGADLLIEARLLEASFVPRVTLPRTSGYAVIELSAVNAAAVLDVELPFLVSMLGRLAGAPGRPGPVTAFTRIEEAAYGVAALVGLHALRQHRLLEHELAPRLSTVTTDRAEVISRIDEGQRHLCLQLSLRIDGERGQARLLVPARVVQSLAEGSPAVPLEAALAPGIAAARVPARALCAARCLTPQDLLALQRGDVVLFDELRLSAGQVLGPLRLATPLFDLFGELTPSGFSPHRGSRRVYPQEFKMSHTPAVVPSDPFAPVPIEVEVELTRVQLSISDLATLRPGSLLPLHVNSSDPVLLRIGDRAVARAELVEIEGEIGARVLALLP